MRALPLIWTMAGACVALAQSGSVTGVVLDSATQGPVRKAQVMLLYRGPASGMAVAQGGLAGGGAIGIAGTLFDPSAARAMGRAQTAVIAPAPRGGLLMGPGGAPNQSSAALSDSGGGFVFRDVPPGMYTVQATHPRYPVRPGGPVGSEVEVKAGEAARVSISLTPGASLNGRILDEDGEPLQGCTVQLRSPSSRQQWVGTAGSELSNERGEYRLYGVQAGRYLAFASCGRPVFQPRPFSAGPPPPPSLAYPAVYYPQTADPSAATAIELSAGLERSGIDFQMTPARVFTVTGTLTGFDRQPGRQLMVNLHQPKAQQMPFGNRGGRVNPETGAFEIQNVFAGSYVIVATQFSPDMNGGAWTARQAVEVTERPVQVSLTLQKPVDLRGEFVVEGNQDLQKGHLSLIVIPEEQAAPIAPPRAEPQPDGSFLLRNTPQGRWVLHVSGPNVYLRSVEAGGQMLQGNVLDTTSGTIGPVRVVVSTRTARMQGRGTPGKMYSLIREDGDPRLTHPFVSHADVQGTVRIEGLPPGKYGVYEGTVPDETLRLDTVTLAEEQVLDLDLTRRTGR